MRFFSNMSEDHKHSWQKEEYLENTATEEQEPQGLQGLFPIQTDSSSLQYLVQILVSCTSTSTRTSTSIQYKYYQYLVSSIQFKYQPVRSSISGNHNHPGQGQKSAMCSSAGGAHYGKVHALDFFFFFESSEPKPSKVNASCDIKFTH